MLLPSLAQIGSSLDNVQWETILRSVSGQRAYRWLTQGRSTAVGIADFVIFDGRLPRSLKYSVGKLVSNLGFLERDYGARHPCHDLAEALNVKLSTGTIAQVFDDGLHEFITDFIADIGRLGGQIETDLPVPGIGPMHLRILHTSAYRFDHPVSYGLQQLRLTPKSRPGQRVLSWDMVVEGGRIETEYPDHHMNSVALISFDPQASAITVRCDGLVETEDHHGVTGRHLGHVPLWLFQRSTELTRAGPNVRALAKGLKDEYEADLPRLHALSGAGSWPGSPTRSARPMPPPAPKRRSIMAAAVCQDHAHVFVAARPVAGLSGALRVGLPDDG